MYSYYFKGIKINICTLESAGNYILSRFNTNKPAYICVTDVGNLVNACRKSPGLKNAINNSLLSLPDGRPLSLYAKLKGIDGIDRVAGPDFMRKIFEMTSGNSVKHFFLGDTEEILEKLNIKINKDFKIRIAGSFSPEFGKWDEKVNSEIIRRLNDAGADLIWVSLGGGKQENWMHENYVKLNKGIMIGVGAAFRFYLGEIKRAPLIFQKSGFEWLFRLIQQPSKMFKRYLTTLPYFVFYTVQEFFKKPVIHNNNN